MLRMLKYAWFILVMRLTGWLPDFIPIMRFRGWLLRLCFRRCGRNFQICSHAMIVYTSNVSIGNDVYIAYGSWIQGLGGVTIEDEVMLGPYTILATNDHTRVNRSFRYGAPRAAPIVMKRGSWTGAHAVLTAGVTLGAGSAAAAGSVVTRDVPDDVVVGGVPARVLRSLAPEAEGAGQAANA
ncbi:MAG: sugar O-acetyltransferase [Planctomycetota bacterium]